MSAYQKLLKKNKGVFIISKDSCPNCDKIKDLFDVNFFSQLYLTQKLLKNMIKNKKGSIINISSNAAEECDVGRGGYSASKAALVAFTKVLSKEVGNFNIRVNAVAPGLTKTNMMEKLQMISIYKRIKFSFIKIKFSRKFSWSIWEKYYKASQNNFNNKHICF